MPEREWLLFIAQLPANPSSLRVRVWRKLRDAGAASLQNGVWVLPRNVENTLLLERLLANARQNTAGGQIFIVHGLNQAVNDDILDRFRSDRDQEYEEFLEQCAAFMGELEKETGKQKFTFAELEENEQSLQRLRKWISKIQKRDFLTTEKSQESIRALHDCHNRLQIYAHKVYMQEGMESSLIYDFPTEEMNSSDQEVNDDTE